MTILYVSISPFDHETDGNVPTLLTMSKSYPEDGTDETLISVQECSSDLSSDLSPNRVPEPRGYLFGNNVTLTCTGKGYPVPNIQFYKNDQLVGRWGESVHPIPSFVE